jgi:hypothetical protein
MVIEGKPELMKYFPDERDIEKLPRKVSISNDNKLWFSTVAIFSILLKVRTSITSFNRR